MKLKDFFYFNRSDRNVVIFLLLLVVVCCSLFAYLGDLDNSPLSAPSDSLLTSKSPISSLPANGTAGRQSSEYYRQEPVVRLERFPFDPNTADSSQLLRLGLRPWQVRNIYRYRATGHVFRSASDFANLYGLTQKEYRELEPYIRISADYQPAADRYGTDRTLHHDSLKAHYPKKLLFAETIDLNTADTTQLMRVPGIGTYFAREIASYRQRLGGFYMVDQLTEIPDFPEKALSYFTVDEATVKLPVNKLTLNQLKRHPYINYYQAKAITDYRRLRGPLKSFDDLRLLSDFTSADLERLSHYVVF